MNISLAKRISPIYHKFLTKNKETKRTWDIILHIKEFKLFLLSRRCLYIEGGINIGRTP